MEGGTAVADTSYAYASGNVRAREPALLQKQDIEQLLGQKDLARLEAALRDKGFGEAADADIDAVLRTETARLWQYLRAVSPDFTIYDPFLYRHDYHNLKTVLKGVFADRAYEALLLAPSTVPIEDLQAAVKERRFDRLPGHMRAAAGRAYDFMAHAADAQMADVVLDRAAMEAMRDAPAVQAIPLLREWVDVTLFYSNAKVALRAARTKKDAAFLDAALCPCAGVALPELAHAAVAGVEDVLKWLEKRDLYGSRRAAELYRESPSAFEKYADNRAMACVRRAKYVTMGPELLIGYLVARETEIRSVAIVASGLRAGQEEALIRERLRELYG